MKMILAALFLIVTSAHAANKEWVSIQVKVKSHHGNDETMNLKILKDGKAVKLIVDNFVLPETRILTNKQDLETIVNYSQSSKEGPCGRDTYTYVKKVDGKSTQFSGCPTTKQFQQLRASFRNISVIN